MGRVKNSHPKADVEEALRHAEKKGWKIEVSRSHSHAWGKIYCPYNSQECRCGDYCITSIWSTPKNPKNHARQIYKVVDNCIYCGKFNNSLRVERDKNE